MDWKYFPFAASDVQSLKDGGCVSVQRISRLFMDPLSLRILMQASKPIIAPDTITRKDRPSVVLFFFLLRQQKNLASYSDEP